MTYDFIGEKLRKIKGLMEAKRYYLASLELMTLLKFFSPGTTEWIKLMNLVERIVFNIENVDQRAHVLLLLAQYLRNIDYRGYEKIVSIISELQPLLHDEDLKHEIATILKGKAQEVDKHTPIKISSNYVLGELNKIKNKLYVDPYAASELEAFYVNYEKLLDDEVKKFVNSLLNEFPPKITTEIEFPGSNTILFPSGLEFKIKLLNKGYRTANDIKLVVKLNSPDDTEEHLINPIIGSSFRLRPGESRELNIKVPLRKLGTYSVSVDIIYYDAVGKEYKNSIKVLENLNVVAPSISEITNMGEHEFNDARKDLGQYAYELLDKVAELCDAILDNRSEKEIIDYYKNLVKDLELNFLNKLRKVLDMRKKYWKSCEPAIDFYKQTISKVEEKVKLLREISDEKVVEKSRGTIVLGDDVHKFLRELVDLIFIIVIIEDDKKLKNLYDKLKKIIIERDPAYSLVGLDKVEINLIALKYSFSSESPNDTLNRYRDLKEALRNKVFRGRVNLEQSIQSIIEELKELVGKYKC